MKIRKYLIRAASAGMTVAAIGVAPAVWADPQFDPAHSGGQKHLNHVAPYQQPHPTVPYSHLNRTAPYYPRVLPPTTVPLEHYDPHAAAGPAPLQFATPRQERLGLSAHRHRRHHHH